MIRMVRLVLQSVEYAKAPYINQAHTTARDVPTKKVFVPCVERRYLIQRITNRPPSDWIQNDGGVVIRHGEAQQVANQFQSNSPLRIQCLQVGDVKLKCVLGPMCRLF